MSSHQQLANTLERISEVLGPNKEQHSIFQGWALAQLRQLVNAERHSRAKLCFLANEFHQEYLELQQELVEGVTASGGTQLLRSARREWLSAVLEMVDALLETRQAA